MQTNEERDNFPANFVYIMMVSRKEDNIIEIIKKDKDKPLNRYFMSIYEEIAIENIKKGEQIGIKKGEQIGVQKKQTKVVLKSHENSISISLISNITNLSEEKVVEILRKHGKEI